MRLKLFGVFLILFVIGSLSLPANLQAQVVTPAPLENSPYDAEVFKIADQLQCPVCQGQTVAFSNSGLAQQMRALIKKKLEEKQTQAQILQYFVERYGDGILTNPPPNGFTVVVWILPFVIFLVAVGVVGYVLRGWRRKPNEVYSRTPPVEVTVPLSREVWQEYEARVEREYSSKEQN